MAALSRPRGPADAGRTPAPFGAAAQIGAIASEHERCAGGVRGKRGPGGWPR